MSKVNILGVGRTKEKELFRRRHVVFTPRSPKSQVAYQEKETLIILESLSDIRKTLTVPLLRTLGIFP